MAGTLLALLDDIATVLDDVAAMTKVAATKTAGVLGDDLALNAKQVTGVRPTRELAVVWSVARGSAFNKLFLVPAALAISWTAPWAIPPLLVAGGAFLCFEGAEKIFHRLMHGADAGHKLLRALAAGEGSDDAQAMEQKRISAAIRTDFILSAEIIVITLGVVAGKPLVTQLGVMVAISVAMTIGVYGLVAAIVKLDDVGALLAARNNRLERGLGRGILAIAPWLMRGLSVAGTAAMFLVGGGIIVHALPAMHAMVHDRVATGRFPLPTLAFDAAVGLVTGVVLVGAKAAAARLNRILA
jgi:predicted DNA repair protein MutK